VKGATAEGPPTAHLLAAPSAVAAAALRLDLHSTATASAALGLDLDSTALRMGWGARARGDGASHRRQSSVRDVGVPQRSGCQ
jgi:hypothetical protein